MKQLQYQYFKEIESVSSLYLSSQYFFCILEQRIIKVSQSCMLDLSNSFSCTTLYTIKGIIIKNELQIVCVSDFNKTLFAKK